MELPASPRSGLSPRSTGNVVPVVGIFIPFTEVVQSKEPYVVYCINVEEPGRKWMIKRRFSELKGLHDQLKEVIEEEAKHLRFPAKNPLDLFGHNMKSSVVEERRWKLQDFLQAVVGNPHLRDTKEFRAFIYWDPQCEVDEVEFKREQIQKYLSQQNEGMRSRTMDGEEEKDEHKEDHLRSYISVTIRKASISVHPSLPDGKHDDSLEQSKREAMRDNVAREIITTEGSYLEKLIFVIQKYKIPLEEAIKNNTPILKMKEVDLIFGNIESVKNVSKTLFSKLNANSSSSELIAKIFIDMAPFLEAYIPYISNFDEGFIPTYVKMKQNPAFLAFERDCESDIRASRLNLPDLMVMPVQRVPRLKLLLEQLTKYTSASDSDYPTICAAQQAIQTICEKINARLL